MARKIERIVTFGAQDSVGQVSAVAGRFRAALEKLPGLQQPARSKTPEDAKRNEKARAQGWAEVEDMVRDIAMGLTGSEITFLAPPSEAGTET
jgi:hypothetical protein